MRFFIWNIPIDMSLIILLISVVFIDQQIFSIHFHTTGLILSNQLPEDNVASNTLNYYYPNITISNNNNNELLNPYKSKRRIWAALPKHIDLLRFPQMNNNERVVKQGTNAHPLLTDQSKPKFRRESVGQKISFNRQNSQKYLYDNDNNNKFNRNDLLYNKMRPRFSKKAFNYANFTCPNECKCHLTEVECKNAQLEFIPSNIPLYTEKL
ncbi:unnamed protein product [Schistosoma turkestanicum]|nr:unnamed protein product [Schistosoma turkestanicum]